MERGKLIMVGLGLMILAAAVFTAGQLLGRTGPDGDFPGAPKFIGRERATELPATAADVIGIFDRVADNGVYVGTHVTKFERRRECDTCPVQHNIAYDGPMVEVLTTHHTIVYRDVTNMDGPVIDGKIQEQVALGDFNEIGPNALVEAWGERQGDRLVARVMVYRYLP
jgi:hypothetical protein